MMEVDLEGGLARFGHESFRPGQREAIETLLDVGRLLLVAPTGGGKSLTYQLPAALLPGTTLVISPLIALMADQVAGLERHGIAATYLASTLDTKSMKQRMARMAEGHYELVYVAPERLFFPGFSALLREMDIPLVAVDEAHCISEWGHDFRPEYSRLGGALQGISNRILACTATATPIVRDEIIAKLNLPPDTPQIVRGFARPNLRLRAQEIGGKKDRSQAVDALLEEALGSAKDPSGSAIVYSPTRKATEQEAERLEKKGWSVGAYHAGLDTKRRQNTQDRFINHELDVVVATNAFGMGIDRSDVRGVVHLAPPSSIEAYYQEVGRAGRDGDPAFGLMLYSSQDFPLRRRLIEFGADGGAIPTELFEHKWGMFLELMRWAEGGSCRHDAILRYFADDDEVLGGCGKCDVCLQMEQPSMDVEEATLLVRKALSGVARIHGRFGLTAASKLLVGASDPRLERARLTEVSTFGILSDRKEAWVTRLLRRCVTAGWVTFSSGRHPLAFLTDEGREVMQGSRPARLLIPTESVTTSKPRRRKPAEAIVFDDDPDTRALFEALRAKRLELARADAVPPYVVVADRGLRDIAMLRPRSLDELQQAHGIGPAKAEKYGEALLAVIAEGA